MRRYDSNLSDTEKHRLPPNMKSYDLTPNQNLQLSERILQYSLLKQIENFGAMASQLDKLNMLNQYKQMHSEALTECFTQIYLNYHYNGQNL